MSEQGPARANKPEFLDIHNRLQTRFSVASIP
jgi:hypothetical protein